MICKYGVIMLCGCAHNFLHSKFFLMGEIDDIFSGKSAAKGKTKEPEAKPVQEPKKKKKKSKKAATVEKPAAELEEDKPELEPEDVPASITGTKRKIPETVVDPSLEVEGKAKKSKTSKKEKKSAGVDSDDERFRDSRGTGPRRRTEEGYAIYKEDELGINDEGGDTPLCPFDCDCCF